MCYLAAEMLWFDWISISRSAQVRQSLSHIELGLSGHQNSFPLRPQQAGSDQDPLVVRTSPCSDRIGPEVCSAFQKSNEASKRRIEKGHKDNN